VLLVTGMLDVDTDAWLVAGMLLDVLVLVLVLV